jgi:RHS repeat-associated protein
MSAGVNPLFTGKERDAESGLDYFGARYFSGLQGRWTSPDKPFADQHLIAPQSWNLYGYVRNNPIILVDTNGEASCETKSGAACRGNWPSASGTDRAMLAASVTLMTYGLAGAPAGASVAAAARAGGSAATAKYLENPQKYNNLAAEGAEILLGGGQGPPRPAISISLDNLSTIDHSARYLVRSGVIKAAENSNEARTRFREIATGIAANPIKVVEGFKMQGGALVTTLVGKVDDSYVFIQVLAKDFGKKRKAEPLTAFVPTDEQLKAVGIE